MPGDYPCPGENLGVLLKYAAFPEKYEALGKEPPSIEDIESNPGIQTMAKSMGIEPRVLAKRKHRHECVQYADRQREAPLVTAWGKTPEQLKINLRRHILTECEACRHAYLMRVIETAQDAREPALDSLPLEAEDLTHADALYLGTGLFGKPSTLST